MAERTERVEKNAAGKFYVDSSCIDCDLCRESAPEFFCRDDVEGISYVWQQPRSSEDIELCEDIVDSCPVQSIGDDGEQGD